ncbi:hypothetical protein [Bifidobacterium catenulatum]|uniref:hypothetical protein n=1 Tax=Bifidobacterium catenulatum TaxID=1686 RepID=UPI002A3E987F|nr:hypothetical protein [Bifidobacterium catenulatum]
MTTDSPGFDVNQEDDETLPNDRSVTIYCKPDADSTPVIKGLVASDSVALELQFDPSATPFRIEETRRVLYR